MRDRLRIKKNTNIFGSFKSIGIRIVRFITKAAKDFIAIIVQASKLKK